MEERGESLMGYASFICPECDAHTRFGCSIYNGKLRFQKNPRRRTGNRINCSSCGKCFYKKDFIMVKKGVYTAPLPLPITPIHYKRIRKKVILVTKKKEITKEELLKKMFRPVIF